MFVLGSLIWSETPVHGMVTLTFTVGLPSLNLSGNTVTDMPRGVSPKRFQVQSS